MHGSISGVMALVVVAGLALPVSGQAPASQTTSAATLNPVHPPLLPYTAEYKVTQVRRLADGTTITHDSTEVMARDSQGRQMTSSTDTPLSADQTPKTRVNVSDPMAHTTSIWSVPGQKATVIAIPAFGAARPACAQGVVGSIVSPSTVQRLQRVKPVVEDLGTDTVDGIEARGRRTTTTTPAGASGNNEPLVRTSETWTAAIPGLNLLLVRSVYDDPQIGKATRELTNLSQSEPDASVFQPPQGYEIVNKEAGGCPAAIAISAEPPTPAAEEPAPEQ